MFLSLFRFLAIPALIVGAAWLAAIIYFQQSEREIVANDLLLWFVVVPLGAALVWVVARAAIKKISAPAPAAAPDAPAATPQAAPAQPTLAVLAAEFHTAAGEDSAALRAALDKGEPKPVLHARLQDDEGRPVRALECPDLDVDAYREWVERWCAARPESEQSALRDRERGARLIALAAGPVARALGVLAELPVVQAAASQPEAKAACPVVTKIFAPQPWQEMLVAYVREQAAGMPGVAIGMVRATAAPAQDQPDLQHDAHRVADAFCAASASQYAQSALLILGCDSLVTEDAVAALDRERRLFSPDERPLGRMPGEAAAALLALPTSCLPAGTAPLARVHRAGFALRQKPADARGRIDSTTLDAVVVRALEVAAANGDKIGDTISCAVSDCDHRAPWLAELGQLVNERLPKLDLMADHLALGSGLGYLGEASSVLSLSVAAALAQEAEGPVLSLGVDHPQERSSLVLEPWLPSHS